MLPDVVPDGVDGVFGGLLTGGGAALMVTEKPDDQPDSAAFESIVFAFTAYIPADAHECDAEELAPESTRPVVPVVVSPQSNVYFTWFASGSVALVVYE